MEKVVNMIKSVIYEVEVKLLVGKGEISEEQKDKEKEIEKLKKRLDYAKSIEDPARKFEEMNIVKKMIDDVHSEEIKLLIEQGNQLAEAKVFEEAFEFYEKALKINEIMEEPDIKNKDLVKTSYKRELINKANLEIEKKNFDSAIKSCARAIELDNNFIKAIYYTGIAYSNKKKHEMAIKSFENAVSLDPNHIDSWSNIGLAYEHLNNLEKAKQAYEKTLEIKPDFFMAFYNIANIFKQTGEFDKAIENYMKATILEPDLARAWFFMGCSYFDKEEYNDGIKYLEKAIKLDPNLAQDIHPLIKTLKVSIDKLKESLSFLFLNR
ncbi:MAG TPA: tetratricopeptide repeat protein, partial [archaeon]|nr:tetratricopeptide repeat protein [archaeon]